VKLGSKWWKRIKTTLTLPMQHHLLHFSILNQEKIWVKLNKCIVVKSETMNTNKILISGGNMKDIGEGKRVSGGGNNERMNLVMTSVRIMHREMVKVTSYIICST
jgi:hypothetical protein